MGSRFLDRVAFGGGRPGATAPVTSPIFTTAPSISPTSGLVGATFAGSNGVASNATSYTRRWLLDDVAIGTGASVVPGSAGSLVLEVTATGPGGTAVATSVVTVTVATPVDPPVNSVLPAITGTAQEGQTLGVSTGSWSGSPSFAYQWRRDGVAISGSINSTRVLQAADVGAVMTCTVTAANAGGSTSATSAATSAVIAASTPVPVNTAAPVVSGTPDVGQTLTTTDGSWTNSPTSYAYQWRRDGVNITGATSTTYVLVNADVGASISCRVTATNAGGSTPQASNGTAAVTGPTALSYPAQGAQFDLDWANAQFFGGIQPDTSDSGATDGRFFKQQIMPNLPAYAERADGSLRRYTTGAFCRRGTGRGLLIEPEVATSVQPILWTNDLTNAAWIKTNVTAAKNQTGRDGVANGCSLITATAADATILYPITGSMTRNLWADIKRMTGTGPLFMTQDGGTTWTEITLDKPRNGGWGRYGLPLATVTNPSFGFRIGTAGDQFAIGFVTADNLAFETSPWDQSGTARRRRYDRPSSGLTGSSSTAVSSGLMEFIRDNANWGLFFEWTTLKENHFLFGQILRPFSGGSIRFSTTDGSGASLSTAAGVHRVSPSMTDLRVNRAYAFTQGGAAKLCVNGGAVLTAASGFGAYTTLDHKDLGSNGAGTENMAGYIARATILAAPWTDAEAVLRTTVS